MKGYKLELRTLQQAKPTDAPVEAQAPSTVRYRDLLELVLRTAPPVGWQPGLPLGVDRRELKRRNAIRRELVAANGALVLSEEQGDYLKALVDGYRWPVVTFEAEQFADDIAEMPKVELKEKGE